LKSLPLVSVIILNYNGVSSLHDNLFRFLRQVLETDYQNFEVILVDNGSTDGSFDALRHNFAQMKNIKLVALKENVGYAKANNIGCKFADPASRYFVFLNNDVMVTQQWLQYLVSNIEKDTCIGAIGGKIMQFREKNMIDSAGGYLDFLGYIYGRRGILTDVTTMRDVFFVFGSAIMVRRNVFERIGGFQEQFFLGYEEIDLCWRIWISGFKVKYVPQIIGFHVGSATTKSIPNSVMIFHATKNRLFTLFSNYELKNIIKYVGFIIVINILDFLYNLKKNSSVSLSYLRSWAYIIKHLRIIIQRRMFIKAIRSVSDYELFKRRLIIRPLLLNKLRGQNFI